MAPPMKDPSIPCETLPIVNPTTTFEYQTLLIESRDPNSRGVRMLCVGLVDIDKTYIPRSFMASIALIVSKDALPRRS